MSELTADDIGTVISDIVRTFPADVTYPRQSVSDIFYAVIALASRVNGAAQEYYSDKNIGILPAAYMDVAELFVGAFTTKNQTYAQKYTGLLQGWVAGISDIIIAPSFKSDTVDLLLSAKAAITALIDLQATKPWWAGFVLDVFTACLAILELVKALLETAYHVLKAVVSIPWELWFGGLAFLVYLKVK